MKVKFERVYKNYSIGAIADIDNKEELDYLINTKTVNILEDFGSSEIEEIKEAEEEEIEEKSNKKGKSKK